MSLRAFFNTELSQPLKNASGEILNKKTQLSLNNLAIRFQLSRLFELCKQTKSECLLLCQSHKLSQYKVPAKTEPL